MSQKMKNVLACDLGASGGRAMLGRFDGRHLALEEAHRFPNEPVRLGNRLYWDFPRLFHEVKAGLVKAKTFGEIASVSVDTWGVDFGLLDKQGHLMENPVHYRDARTQGTLEKALERISKEQLYRITGNQFMEINTAFQLLSIREEKCEQLQQADCLLMMPDLFHFFLCGRRAAEKSIASTSQLFDAERQDWSGEVIEGLGLPMRLFPQVVSGGICLGTLLPAVQDELGLENIQIIAGAEHDTQSALAATPADEEDFIFLSCGTWSLIGTELSGPLIDNNAFTHNLTNESAFGGKTSFLKNVTGLWMIQECRRQWRKEGGEFSYGQMEEMARVAPPLRSFIDPDDPDFSAGGNLPYRIREYCRRTIQPVPETHGEMIRCIEESLAMAYRQAVEEIQACTGKDYPAVYLVGGGSRNTLLCEMTACACGCPVYAGPAEATALGNIIIQLIAQGEVGGLAEARELIRSSQPVRIFEPGEEAQWNEAYERYQKIVEYR